MSDIVIPDGFRQMAIKELEKKLAKPQGHLEDSSKTGAPYKDYVSHLEDIQKHNDAFMKQHHDEMVAWGKRHKDKPVPVSQDKDGKYFWVNRAQRRKMKK